MWLRWATVFGAIAVLTASSRAQSVDGRAELRRLNQEARAAHERKDFPAFLELAQKVVEKAPRSVGALYNLACAQALNDAGSEAVATLDRLASRGAAFDLSDDPDLESLRDLPEFHAVSRRMAALEEPVGSSAVAFTLPDKTLITEGVAHDLKTGDFFVSSVRHRDRPDLRDGTVSDFLSLRTASTPSALDVDPGERPLASSHAPQMEGFATKTRLPSWPSRARELEVARKVELPRLSPGTSVRWGGATSPSPTYTGRSTPRRRRSAPRPGGSRLAYPRIAWSPDGRSCA
jgi:hypothetical protein